MCLRRIFCRQPQIAEDGPCNAVIAQTSQDVKQHWHCMAAVCCILLNGGTFDVCPRSRLWTKAEHSGQSRHICGNMAPCPVHSSFSCSVLFAFLLPWNENLGMKQTPSSMAGRTAASWAPCLRDLLVGFLQGPDVTALD